jgi:hypothetical protein
VSDPQVPQPPSAPPAGWYPDPEDATRTRYWDGTAWAAPQETVPLPGAAIADAPAPVGAATGAFPPATGLPYAPVPPVRETEGFAIVALVLGVLGFFTAFITSIPAVIFGFIARSRVKKSGKDGAGMALAGIITGFVGIFFAILGIILFVALVLIVSKAGSDATGNFNVNTLEARATVSGIGLTVESCKSASGAVPSDQAAFDACVELSGDTNGNGAIAQGYTVDYWARTSTSFCVEVSKADGSTTTTAAWDSTRSVPVTSTCPESSAGTSPTATRQN